MRIQEKKVKIKKNLRAMDLPIQLIVVRRKLSRELLTKLNQFNQIKEGATVRGQKDRSKGILEY